MLNIFDSEPKSEGVEVLNPVVEQLRAIIADYLQARPNMSVNGISKKCNVSEPTLRRIVAGRVKTVPQTTTLLDVLTFISGTSSVREIVNRYQGAIGEYLSEVMPQLQEVDREYSNLVNQHIKNPIKYVIYKLAANHCGVSDTKIMELYGRHGTQMLDEMVNVGIVFCDESGRFRTKAKSFSTPAADIVRNFKVVADYIKPQKHRNRKPLNPFYINTSNSLTPEAYEKIARLQRKTQRKIREIINDPESQGEIPSFFICAFDTLDGKAAYEFEEESSE